MVGNDLEIEIIELFRQDITILLSINQIAKNLGKSYPYIYKKVISFIEQGILNKTTIGSSSLCSINLQSEEAIILLSINEILHKKKVLEKDDKIKATIFKIREIGKEIPIQTSILVDDKIVLVTDNKFYQRALHKEFSGAIILTKIEFQDRVLEDYNPTHTLLYQNEKYYEIMGEIERELKIKNSPIAN